MSSPTEIETEYSPIFYRDGFAYKRSVRLDYETRCFNAVRFNTGRYGIKRTTLCFENKVSAAEAVAIAEEFLSAPLTKEWYNQHKNDIDCPAPTYQEFMARKGKKDRGHLLGEAINLKYISIKVVVGLDGDVMLCAAIKCGS